MEKSTFCLLGSKLFLQKINFSYRGTSQPKEHYCSDQYIRYATWRCVWCFEARFRCNAMVKDRRRHHRNHQNRGCSQCSASIRSHCCCDIQKLMAYSIDTILGSTRRTFKGHPVGFAINRRDWRWFLPIRHCCVSKRAENELSIFFDSGRINRRSKVLSAPW